MSKDHKTLIRSDDGVVPIKDYAVLGDGRSSALIAADGGVDWWCAPCLDAPPLFDRLLTGPAGGCFCVTPRDITQTQRRYLEGSNVLETVYTTTTGRLRSTESLNSGAAGRLPWSEFGRRLEVLEGTVEVDLHFRPGTRAGKVTPWQSTSATGTVFHIGPVMAMLRTSCQLQVETNSDREVRGRLSLAAGQREVVALLVSSDESLPVPPLSQIDGRIDRSDAEWREWSSSLSYNNGYKAEVIRSALALKFLWFSPTGAIAAAVTTSLPERLGGDKNWDYRYAWVRDAAYTIKAFLRVGALPDAKAGFSWLMRTIRKHGPQLRPCYTLRGELVPDERHIDAAGYAGSSPVRVGNLATDQLQLCLYGDVFEMTARFVEAGHVLDPATAHELFVLANACADNWMQKDNGFWELEEEAHYTISKVECWMALDRAIWLADQDHISPAMRPRWERERDRILAWIDAHCWSDKKRAYVLHAGTEKLDASLMLASRFKLAQARPERLASTREAIRKELGSGPLLHRYSGMQREEGAFLACSFWMVEAYALLGDVAEGRKLFEQLLELGRNEVGLMPEMIDTKTGAGLGNVPQGLSHLALIHAAMSLDGK